MNGFHLLTVNGFVHIDVQGIILKRLIPRLLSLRLLRLRHEPLLQFCKKKITRRQAQNLTSIVRINAGHCYQNTLGCFCFVLGLCVGVCFDRFCFFWGELFFGVIIFLPSLLFSSLLFPAVTYFRKQERILHMASSVKTLRVKIAHGDLRHDANTLTGFVELSVNADGSDTIEDIKKKIAVRSVLFVLLRAFFSLLKWMCVTHIIHTQMNTKKN